MKKSSIFILCIACLNITSCAIPPETQKLSVAQELEKNPDLVKTLEIYTCLPSFLGHRDYLYSGCNKQVTESNEFKEQGINYDCLDRNALDYTNTTDECILYRREVRQSKINYFDFRRFIPSDSHIKTETDFLATANKFHALRSKLKECETQNERTSYEKQACKDALLEPIIQFSEQGKKPCKIIEKSEYQKMLKSRIVWFKWVTKHEIKDTTQKCLNAYANTIKQLTDLGQWRDAYEIKEYCAAAHDFPVLDKNAATTKIRESIEQFGTANLCSTDDYKTELKKLGLEL